MTILFWWLLGVQGSVAYGSTGYNGQAIVWNHDAEPGGANWWALTFDGAEYHNGTVCTALSPNLEYAAVENVYRDGELWWCEDQSCVWIPGGGVVYGIDDAGDMWGTSGLANGVGVLWTDDGWTRWEFPHLNRIYVVEHGGAMVRTNDVPRRDVWLDRYDANADGVVNNGDIDDAVNSIVNGVPTRGPFVLDNGDIDSFVGRLTE